MPLFQNLVGRTPAVLVVDMQDYFLRDAQDSEEVKYLIDRQLEVLGICLTEGIPVGVLEYGGINRTRRELRNFARNFPKGNVKTFVKQKNNGFSNKHLRPWLRDRNVDSVGLLGVNADACVLETAIGAKNNCFYSFTSTDLIYNCDSSYFPQKVKRRYEQTLGDHLLFMTDESCVFEGLLRDDRRIRRTS